MKRLLAYIGLAVAFAVAAPPASAGPAREKLDRALKGLKDARSSFTQVRNSPAFGASLTPAKGTLSFRAPRLLKLEFAGASPTTVLVRGDTAWIEQPKAGQVIRTSALTSGAPPLPFLEESVAVIEKAYVVKETGPSGLVDEPRAAAGPIRTVELVLESASGLPKTVVVQQKGDESITFTFARWTVNAGIPAKTFAPVFAPGAKLVEL